MSPEPSGMERTAYESCYACRASGHALGMYGLVSCSVCHGDCFIRVRDSKGRFATKSPPSSDQEARGE